MSRSASPTLIGAFVVGAITLAVIITIMFGGREFFREKNYVVMFFEGSVNGLNVGSPVMFRGVKVGTVTDIRMVLNTETLEIRIPVVAEIDPKSLSRSSPEQEQVIVPAGALVTKGLRAQLQMQSLLTGQLYIELDFQPEKPLRLVGEPSLYPEIPTIPTPIQELGRKLEQFNLEQIIADASATLKGLNELVNSDPFKALVPTFNDTLKDYAKVARNLYGQIEPLSNSAQDTLAQSRSTLSTLRETIESSKAVLARAEETIKKYGDTADHASNVIADAGQVVSEDSRLLYDLSIALEELAGAARAVRALADTLERQPDSILRGKTIPGAK